MKNKLIAVICLSAVLFSCKDDSEKPKDEAPTFTSFTIESENLIDSKEEIEVHLGEAFSFDVTVADDNELSQLQVEIHSAFDDHDHERRSASTVKKDTLSYGPVIRDLSGKEQTETFSIFSENDTNFVYGIYHVEMIVLDEASNRTEKIIEFHLEEEGDHK